MTRRRLAITILGLCTACGAPANTTFPSSLVTERRVSFFTSPVATVLLR